MAKENEPLDSESYSKNPEQVSGRIPSWIKIGAIAAASVVAGGLAATWFYRKTLSRLHQAEQTPKDSNSGIDEERTDDEIWQI
ncbi:MAG TPA: hypothetical protein VMD29_07565 [Terracidiphilus sp.]|jgi:hypothetical protein|nr:hypothetical protein [Terracidiphilus sp.]